MRASGTTPLRLSQRTARYHAGGCDGRPALWRRGTPVRTTAASARQSVTSASAPVLANSSSITAATTRRPQRGFRSRGFKGVYLSAQETRIRRYHELIDDYIEGRVTR